MTADTAGEYDLAQRVDSLEQTTTLLTTTVNTLLGALNADRQPGQVIAAFLDAVDPEEADRLIAERMEFDEDGTSYTEMLLRVLRDSALA